MERYFEINKAGHNIRCKLYCNEPRSVKKVVIFCHGFAGHKDNSAAAKLAERMLSKYKSAALVTFNWPCHGDDVKKKLCLDDCMTYLELVIGHVREKFAPQALHACATSFGGYLTLLYVARQGNPFGKIALRCPAVPMYDVLTGAIVDEKSLEQLRRGRDAAVGFDRKVPVSPAFLEELRENDIRGFDYLDYAEDILILHGTADEIVPFAAARDFADNNLIEFIPVAEADHRFRSPRAMDQAIKAMLEFYSL